MTFMVNKHTDGKRLVVSHTYGPVRTEMTEDPGHLRAFWRDLGRALDEAEKTAADPTASGEGRAP